MATAGGKRSRFKELEALGFKVTFPKKGHPRVEKDGVFVVTAYSSTCRRIVNNVIRDWRHSYRKKHGVMPPNPRHEK